MSEIRVHNTSSKLKTMNTLPALRLIAIHITYSFEQSVLLIPPTPSRKSKPPELTQSGV